MAKTVLVIGASSAIAQAIIEAQQACDNVYAISRSDCPGSLAQPKANLSWQISDYTEAAISNAVAELLERDVQLDQLFICNGILHNQSLMPEKRVENFSLDAYQHVFQANALVPMLWLKSLKKLLTRSATTQVVVFSARVGSISDNRLGGWYSYRSSKAALNMFIRNIAIEYGRLAKGLQFIAFHPGTTDTPLSKPFQKNVASDKLFQPKFVADRLLQILAELEEGSEAKFLDWQGKEVAW
ncbi:MAG: SDR family NAD(P)-dependent oxidoreductase [Pseudomonadales bacterium]|nr:SDR family NAD(P)-dependent oxidoreductase [Pseudomonadales bacterium]